MRQLLTRLFLCPILLAPGLLIHGLLPGAALAQEPEPAPAPPPYCDTTSGFADFDFWLGSWVVTPRGGDQIAGTNHIEKYSGGCAVMENWVGASGNPGTSINHFNPVTGTWRQLWIANAPYVIDIEGGLEDGSMVLVGTITTYRNGQTLPFRGTWTPNSDGTVRQHFEQIPEGETEWQDWADLTYTRKDRGESE